MKKYIFEIKRQVCSVVAKAMMFFEMERIRQLAVCWSYRPAT